MMREQAAEMASERTPANRTPLQRDCFAELEARHGALLAFWTAGGPVPMADDVQAHCDMVYSLVLLGAAELIDASAAEGFVEVLARRALPGWNGGGEPSLNVHNCAYSFGALNLLKPIIGDRFGQVLANRTFTPDAILNPATGAPRFPARYTHHNWRVSHWLGGVPSLLWSVGSSEAVDAPRAAELARISLSVTDRLLDPATGLIRLYQSRLLQRAFRSAYRLRHDPDLGDVGGVAHILWVNHVAGRNYVARAAICAQATALFLDHAPFMEQVPYCLDFDVVQIVRTAQPANDPFPEAVRHRARQMMTSVEAFFAEGSHPGMTLHKIPGALATYHECMFIAGAGELTGPRDIIREAYWL